MCVFSHTNRNMPVYSLSQFQEIRAATKGRLCLCLGPEVQENLRKLESTLVIFQDNTGSQSQSQTQSHTTHPSGFNHNHFDRRSGANTDFTTSTTTTRPRNQYSLRPNASSMPLSGGGGSSHSEGSVSSHRNHTHHPSSRQKQDDWTTLRSFKPTVVLPTSASASDPTKDQDKEQREKDVLWMRASFNKLSPKNFDTQCVAILDMTANKDAAADAEILHRIVELVFEIASTNKLHVALYARLYRKFVEQEQPKPNSDVFSTQIRTKLTKFRHTFDTMVYADPNVDYDGYCRFIKDNDRRRAFGSFLVEYVAISESSDILNLFVSIVVNLQSKFMSLMRMPLSQDPIPEPGHNEVLVEEMSEVLAILMEKMATTIPTIPTHSEWENPLLQQLELLVKTPSAELKTQFPFATRRILFKQMDLMETIQKTGTRK